MERVVIIFLVYNLNSNWNWSWKLKVPLLWISNAVKKTYDVNFRCRGQSKHRDYPYVVNLNDRTLHIFRSAFIKFSKFLKKIKTNPNTWIEESVSTINIRMFAQKKTRAPNIQIRPNVILLLPRSHWSYP